MMFKSSIKKIIWLIAIILVSYGCVGKEDKILVTQTPQIDQWVPVDTDLADGTSPIEVRLVLSEVPKLNESVDVTMMIFSKVDSPGTIASINLPDSAELLDGNPAWQGDLQAKVPVFLGARLRFIKEGDWVIDGTAQRCFGEGEDWGDTARVSLHVGSEHSDAEITTVAPNFLVCDPPKD